jgi:hypothetical protein
VGALTFAGEGDATVVDGPTPDGVASLGPGASAQFVYELDATAGGSMSINGTLGATTEQGDDVTADAKCSIGEDGDEELLVAGNHLENAQTEAPQVCPVDGGAAVKIDECKITIILEESRLRHAELEGDSEPAADTGYPPGAT